MPNPNLPARLKVSENGRFLVGQDGSPFFYLGDTAWELFHRLNREEALFYLETRAQQGFNVIQATALAELDGLDAPNPYGHVPFQNRNPDQPVEAYWKHVDFIVAAAEKLGLYLAFLPTWGNNWHDNGAIFDPENAARYGEWLGRRYRNNKLIWILGGDRVIEHSRHKDIIRAMARGLREGDEGAHLITFHPHARSSSAHDFHHEPWLDFNMRQNGHGIIYTFNYVNTRKDYDLQPAKPVFDGEPVYEDHPIAFNANENGHSLAIDCRHALYWNLFEGAFGHCYGHHSVWQMFQEGRNPINHPLCDWKEALRQPGADQMRHGRRLLESRPFLSRIPDDTLILPDAVATSVPGTGRGRFVATRDEEGTYAMIYAPVGRAFTVCLKKFPAPELTAWWFNPRDGSTEEIGTVPNQGRHRFIPPNPGEDLDWILVLDDPAKNYPAPGVR